MNREEVIKLLNDKLEVQEITETISSVIFSGEIKNILLLIQNLNKENTNLKQALNDIREYFDTSRFSSQFENNGNEENVKLDILQIIDKVLGDSEQ